MTDQTELDINFGRPFVLVRDTDISGVSGVGVVVNGIQFPDGHVAIHWTGSKWPTTTTPHTCMESVTDTHGHAGATRVVWQPSAIPQPTYSDAWTQLTGWVTAAEEDGEQIEPADLLAYMRELRHNALAPTRNWMNKILEAGGSDA